MKMVTAPPDVGPLTIQIGSTPDIGSNVSRREQLSIQPGSAQLRIMEVGYDASS
jgi:hypothetical protein